MKSLSLIVLATLLESGCAASSYRYREPTYEGRVVKGTVLRSLSLDPEVEEKILRLNPERITERDIKEALARGPTPRIVIIHGSGIPFLYHGIDSFSQFLIGMGYPENKIRSPRDASFSFSSYKSSAEIAGLIAWYYEREGMPVILIGYSSGGTQAVKVLHELAGSFSDRVAVWNPLTDESESRYSILDPISGQERPVVGLRVGHATVAAAGGLTFFLPNQWNMVRRLLTIPDSVEHFTGVSIQADRIGGEYFGSEPGANRYVANGTAKVRNVQLPDFYSHGAVFNTQQLAEDPRLRDWINAYQPSEQPQLPLDLDRPSDNILIAADVWHSIKKQWCLEAQRLIRAKRQMFNGQ